MHAKSLTKITQSIKQIPLVQSNLQYGRLLNITAGLGAMFSLTRHCCTALD